MLTALQRESTMKQEAEKHNLILWLSLHNIPMVQAIAHRYRETYRVPCYPVFLKDHQLSILGCKSDRPSQNTDRSARPRGSYRDETRVRQLS